MWLRSQTKPKAWISSTNIDLHDFINTMVRQSPSLCKVSITEYNVRVV